jgi:hypothetical protein
MTKLHVSYVLLTLGASSIHPKEVYLLDFTGLGKRVPRTQLVLILLLPQLNLLAVSE